MTTARKEFIIYLLLIILAAYLFAPKVWEPGGESLKNWVSARLFREGGGFPVFHHAPLYNLYLQIFLFFKYPLSIELEHFLTHLFAYGCLFLLLRKFLPGMQAFILTAAWIPTLWTIEGGSRLIGIGFLSLYLAGNKKSAMHKGCLPLSLFAAALFDMGYAVFLIGHAIGEIAARIFAKKAMIEPFLSEKRHFFLFFTKTAMVLLIIATILFQSKRPDSNVHAFNYPWAPFPQRNIITVGVLQGANWTYVMRNIPRDKWLYQDWYFTNKEAFGGASNITAAALNNPKEFFAHVFLNLRSAVQTPANFIFGFGARPKILNRILVVMAWLLLPIGFYGALKYYKVNDEVTHIYAIVFGTTAILSMLSLVWFSTRYAIILLPVALIAVAAMVNGILGRPLYKMAAVTIIAVSVLTSQFSYQGGFQFKNLFKNPFLLSGRMTNVYPELLVGVDRKIRILAQEEPWLVSFSNVDPDNAFHVLYLPPFEDSSGETKEFLNSLDIIWVSDALADNEPSIATQRYLRYKLHVEPFLSKAVKEGWTVENIEGFGKIYKRPNYQVMHG